MPAAIRRYLALATKEFQQLRRNRVLLIQLLLPPTVVLVIFGFALNPKVRDLRLGVVDENFTVQSRNFMASGISMTNCPTSSAANSVPRTAPGSKLPTRRLPIV